MPIIQKENGTKVKRRNLNNTVALVTGAGQGIGKSIALRLAKEGALVVVNDLALHSARKVSEMIRARGGRSTAIQADVSDQKRVEDLVSKIVGQYKRIDILVNNVGISPKKNGKKPPFYEISLEEWEHVMNVNLKSVFLCSQTVARYMMGQRSGQIVNISSVAGKTYSGPSGAHYSASKAAVISLTKSMAHELCQYGIRVNSVAPGAVNTPLQEKTSFGLKKNMIRQIPMGRFASPEEIAEAVLFLISPQASYITGEILDVNGGLFMD